MISTLQHRGLLKAGGKQRSDSTYILVAVRTLNRLEMVGETLRQALEALAVAAPTWLVKKVTPDWFERYGQPINEYRLPKSETKQAQLAQTIGQDGPKLLSKIYAEAKLSWLQNLEAVEILRQVWVQQYYNDGQQVQLPTKDNTPPPSSRITSPYDLQARRAKKRTYIY